MGMEHLSQGLKRLQIWDGKRSKMNGRETEVQTLARIQVFFLLFANQSLWVDVWIVSVCLFFVCWKLGGLFKDAVELPRKFIISWWMQILGQSRIIFVFD